MKFHFVFTIHFIYFSNYLNFQLWNLKKIQKPISLDGAPFIS